MGPGTINASSLFVNGAPFTLGNYMPLTGGIISGTLTVDGLLTCAGGIDGVDIDPGTF
jgi:hypothetical protein